jgi:anti-sigma regulatory factor (Ser/Thr protein kinase)
VKSLLTRFFRSEIQSTSIGDPSLPFACPIPIESPLEAQKRILIGIVAGKMALHLRIDKLGQDTWLFLPFICEAFVEDKNDEKQYLLFLSERMVSWIKEKEDVYFRIREMKLVDKYHECFLKVYEDTKHDLVSIFHPQPVYREIDSSSEEGQVWQVYRDVMYAVTQRKFLLIQKHEVDKYKEGELLCEVAIKERSDIAKARDIAKSRMIEAGFQQTQIMSLLLVISEAITNILKHAEDGKIIITRAGQNLYVIVEDKGPGFDLKLLPKTTLLAGYSTKKSLGQGFTLMMKMAQEVLLYTSPKGSTLILVFGWILENEKGESRKC